MVCPGEMSIEEMSAATSSWPPLSTYDIGKHATSLEVFGRYGILPFAFLTEQRYSDSMARVYLKPGIERRLRHVYLWIFNSQIDHVEDLDENGDLVEIYSSKDAFVGVGYYNRHSLIAVRILSFEPTEINSEFFISRLQIALHRRLTALTESTTCRAVYSEADLLPGLIVDRYGDYLSVQALTLGIDRLIDRILPALIETFNPGGIVLRNDSPFRKREGLDTFVSVAHGEIPETVEIYENTARFGIDLLHGQKTGFFFDQRNNRALCRSLSSNRRVLDCFCYSGGFSINGALGGATSVLAVDDSEDALRLVNDNAARNNVDSIIATRKADCFTLLRDLYRDRERFDLIVLDPPAFVKSKEKLREAIRGYKEINLSAMKLLNPGGILITCSCSYQLSQVDFLNMITSAARDAHRLCHVRHLTGQAEDHPVLLTMPETSYLKCAVLEML